MWHVHYGVVVDVEGEEKRLQVAVDVGQHALTVGASENHQGLRPLAAVDAHVVLQLRPIRLVERLPLRGHIRIPNNIFRWKYFLEIKNAEYQNVDLWCAP